MEEEDKTNYSTVWKIVLIIIVALIVICAVTACGPTRYNCTSSIENKSLYYELYKG